MAILTMRTSLSTILDRVTGSDPKLTDYIWKSPRSVRIAGGRFWTKRWWIPHNEFIPRMRTSLAQIRAELAWVNQPVDPNFIRPAGELWHPERRAAEALAGHRKLSTPV